jgi:hypothetical protein
VCRKNGRYCIVENSEIKKVVSGDSKVEDGPREVAKRANAEFGIRGPSDREE